MAPGIARAAVSDFTVTGYWRNHHVVIDWIADGTPHLRPRDEYGMTAIQARQGDTRPLMQTPEGPDYDVADTPDYVAFLVIKEALDTVTDVSRDIRFPDTNVTEG